MTGLAGVARVLAVASITFVVVLRSEQGHREAITQARDAAVTAATQLVFNLDALSSPPVDGDLALVLKGATGHFKQQFTASQVQLKRYVLDRKISSSGQVMAAAAVRYDSDSATVLVAIDRTFKDSTHSAGVVAKDRWKLTMEKHGGRWLVAELEPVA